MDFQFAPLIFSFKAYDCKIVRFIHIYTVECNPGDSITVVTTVSAPITLRFHKIHHLFAGLSLYSHGKKYSENNQNKFSHSIWIMFSSLSLCVQEKPPVFL